MVVRDTQFLGFGKYILHGKIMACFIMTGEIMGRGKYGGISLKPPIFPGHNFTCDFCFAKFTSIMINDDI